MSLEAMRPKQPLQRQPTFEEKKAGFTAATADLNKDAFALFGLEEFFGGDSEEEDPEENLVKLESFKDNLKTEFARRYKGFNPTNLPEEALGQRIKQQRTDLINAFRILYIDPLRAQYQRLRDELSGKKNWTDTGSYSGLMQRLVDTARYLGVERYEKEIIKDQLKIANDLIDTERALAMSRQPATPPTGEEKKQAAEPKAPAKRPVTPPQAAPKAPAKRPVSPPARPLSPPRRPVEGPLPTAQETAWQLQLLSNNLLNLAAKVGQAQPTGEEKKRAAEPKAPAKRPMSPEPVAGQLDLAAAEQRIAQYEAAFAAVKKARKEEKARQREALAAIERRAAELKEKEAALRAPGVKENENQLLQAENARLADELRTFREQAAEAKQALARAAEERQRIDEKATEAAAQLLAGIPEAPAFGEPPAAPPLDTVQRAPAKQPAQRPGAGVSTADELKAERARQLAAGQRTHDETPAAKKAREEAEAKRRAALTEEEKAREDKVAQETGLLGEIQRGRELKRVADRKIAAEPLVPTVPLTEEEKRNKAIRDAAISGIVKRWEGLRGEDSDDDKKEDDDEDWGA